EARKRVRELDPAETKGLVERGEVQVLLDVREPDEWRRGRLPGAIHVPLGTLRSRADPSSPMANQELTGGLQASIVAYCARGNRSVLAADLLQKMGYTNVASMRGGIVDWAKEGYPVE
ncbi:MAG: rhodanese-like domain-containing protein, partial [Acidimicrobiales bacterium]